MKQTSTFYNIVAFRNPKEYGFILKDGIKTAKEALQLAKTVFNDGLYHKVMTRKETVYLISRYSVSSVYKIYSK